jgi:hypothetical protein
MSPTDKVVICKTWSQPIGVRMLSSVDLLQHGPHQLLPDLRNRFPAALNSVMIGSESL